MKVAQTVLAATVVSLAHARQLNAYDYEVNEAPTVIMACVLIACLSLFFVFTALDNYQRYDFQGPASFTVEVSKQQPPKDSSQPNPTSQPRASPQHGSRPSRPKEDSSSSSSSEKEDGRRQGEYTDNYYIEQEGVGATAGPLVQKTVLGQICEGHLTFGLYLYREDYSRPLRIFTILVIWLFDLFFIGAFIAGEEDVDEDTSDYDGGKFAYTIYTLLISVPVAVFFIFTLSKRYEGSIMLFLVGVAVGTVVIIATIVGIVFLNYDMRFGWGEAWALDFLICMIFEVLLLETIYMVVRWLIVRPKAQESK